jgi:hypothetical protein
VTTSAPAPDPITTTSSGSSGIASGSGTALFADGTPVSNFQLFFQYGDGGGDWADMTTDSQGNFQIRGNYTCTQVCEIWIYVPPTQANQTLFNGATNYRESNCALPLAASADAQNWTDIQLTTSTPSTLYVVNSACDEDWSLPGAIDNFNAISSMNGPWEYTGNIEALMESGQLDETQAYAGL